MVKIAIFYDEKVLEDKDMSTLKSILLSELGSVEGLDVVELCADRASAPPEALQSYSLAIFCGYSLHLLSALFAAMAQGIPVLLYDLPGDSIERELNSILFSGVDSQRLPSSVLSQVTHSWTYRDIVGICRQISKNAPAEGTPGNVDRPRQVENPGEAQTRKRTTEASTKSKK
jgi:hypothetical protein